MLDAMAALLTYQAGIYFATGETPARMGNRHPTIVPYRRSPRSTASSCIAVGNDDQFRRLCRASAFRTWHPTNGLPPTPDACENYAVLKPALDLAIGSWKRRDLLTALTPRECREATSGRLPKPDRTRRLRRAT